MGKQTQPFTERFGWWIIVLGVLSLTFLTVYLVEHPIVVKLFFNL